MKSGLPWILVVVLFAMTGFLFNKGKTQEKQLAELQSSRAEVEQLRGKMDELEKAVAQNSGSTLSAKEREELIRLRNQVGQLRREKEQLSTQFQQTQRDAERALQLQQSQQAQQLAQLQQQNQQLAQQSQAQQGDQARNQCINNMRQIDGAKQQWALENRQPSDAIVTSTDIAPYLRNTQVPACPSGGVYTLNNVELPPSCSVAGHALPQ